MYPQILAILVCVFIIFAGLLIVMLWRWRRQLANIQANLGTVKGEVQQTLRAALEPSPVAQKTTVTTLPAP